MTHPLTLPAAAITAALFTGATALAQPHVIAVGPPTANAERHVIQIAGGSSDADTLPGSLCTGEDWVVFSGTSQKNGKIVSICMNEGDDSTPGHLTYRFGRPGNVELVYPENRSVTPRAFTLRVYTRPQTTYLKFEFEAGGYEFAILEGYDYGATDATLRVTRLADGKVVARHPLARLTEPLALMQLDGAVTTAPFDE